ncbi:MAG: MFS transporter [Erysipelotrichaceae bacterium]|nr:MFS transporter [Erysipelotrichaceae bacterium]
MRNTTDRKKLHYAWIILLGAILIQSGGAGLLSNSASLFYGPIKTDLGITNAQMSLYTSIRTVFMAVGMAFVSTLLRRLGGRRTMILHSLLLGLSFAAMYLFHDIRLWYLIAPVSGFGLGGVTIVGITLFIANWFREKRGLALGVALSASGIVPVLANPLISRIIGQYGWRNGVLVTAAAGLLLTLSGSMLMVYKPEEKGMKAYGEVEEESAGPVSADKTSSVIVLLIAFFLACIPNGMVALVNQFSMMTEQLGQPLALAARISSLAMLGNTLGKIILGTLSDRIGSWKTMILAFGATMFACLGFSTADPFIMSISSPFLGMCFSVTAMAGALIVGEIYAGSYSRKLSQVNTVGVFVSSAASLLIGWASDYFGSYSVVYLTFVLIDLFCILGIVYIMNKTKTPEASRP